MPISPSARPKAVKISVPLIAVRSRRPPTVLYRNAKAATMARFSYPVQVSGGEAGVALKQ